MVDACNNGATGTRNRALLTFLYRSGLRVGEVCNLRPSDVDMARHSIRLLDSKSGRAQTRGYHPSADLALAEWMDLRKALGLDHNGTKLFCTLAGGPMSASYCRQMMKRAAVNAGIEKRVHPHGLRHTFAVELEASGATITTISKLLGHSSVRITAIYVDHLTNSQAVVALQSVDFPPLRGKTAAA